MLEKDLQSEVLRLCEKYHQAAYHSFDSRKQTGSSKGFPDLVLVGRDVLFAELKSYSGNMAWKQTTWAYKLKAAKARYYLWRPADLDSGEIERILAENELLLYGSGPMTIKT